MKNKSLSLIPSFIAFALPFSVSADTLIVEGDLQVADSAVNAKMIEFTPSNAGVKWGQTESYEVDLSFPANQTTEIELGVFDRNNWIKLEYRMNDTVNEGKESGWMTFYLPVDKEEPVVSVEQFEIKGDNQLANLKVTTERRTGPDVWRIFAEWENNTSFEHTGVLRIHHHGSANSGAWVGERIPLPEFPIKVSGDGLELSGPNGEAFYHSGNFDSSSVTTALGLASGESVVTANSSGDLMIAGDVEAGSGSAFGRYSVTNPTSNTIGAIEAPNFGNSYIYLANDDQHRLGFDPNQIVADVPGHLNIWNVNPDGEIIFRTGGSSANGRSVAIDSHGRLGLGTLTPSSKLDVNGDVSIAGDLTVAGQINNSNLVKDGAYIHSRSNFHRDGFLSYELNNFLFSADRRFVVSQSGQSEGQVAQLFDNEFDQYSVSVDIPDGVEYRLAVDLTTRKDGVVDSNGIAYPRGYAYINFYYKNRPLSVDLELTYKNGTSNTVAASSMNDLSNTWRAIIPNTPFLQKIEFVIVGMEADAGTPYSRLTEVSYHMTQPTGVPDAYFSKYKQETLHHPLTFYDVNHSETIQLDSETGTITATDLQLSGNLDVSGPLTSGGHAVYHSGNFDSSSVAAALGLAPGESVVTTNSSGDLTISGDLEVIQSPSINAFQVSSDTSTEGDVFVVDADGHVGIGVQNPSTALEINGTLRVNEQSGNETPRLSLTGPTSRFNIAVEDGAGRVSQYWNSSTLNDNGEHLYLVSGEEAGHIRFHPDASSSPLFSIASAPIGTAGDPIVWTDRFVIDDNGNVGIGTDSPAAKLDVNGDSNVDGVLTVTGAGVVAPNRAIILEGAGGRAGGLLFSGTNGGGGEGFSYTDDQGDDRSFLYLPGANETALANRGANGFVTIRANNATAGGTGEQSVATFRHDKIELHQSVDLSGDLGISGTLEITPVGDTAPALTVSSGGQVTLSNAQGDISMGAFGTGL